MQAIMTVGLDIAKSVFQVHGVDADDNRAWLVSKLALRHITGLVNCRRSVTRSGSCRRPM
jgi:transposase